MKLSTLSLILAAALAAVACSKPQAGDAPDDAPPTEDPGETNPGGKGGGDPSADQPWEPCAYCDDGLFPAPPRAGKTSFHLTPSPATPSDETVLVAFGVPLPKGALASVDQLVVADQSGEIPTHVEELARWRPLGSDAGESSVRGVLVFLEVAFPGGQPVELSLQWGAERTRELGPQGDPRDTWVAGTDTGYSSPLEEPAAYAAFSPAWLGACLLRGRTNEVHADGEWAWFDEALLGYGATGVNDLPDGVSGINFESGAAPWLYDRAMTIFGIYVRTGDTYWLRHAHFAAQYYADRVDSGGYFELKGSDLKYSYGLSLVSDYLFTGDPRIPEVVERVAQAGSQWDEVYTTGINFWTERHQTYALLAALSAWELTGEEVHADRVRAIIAASSDLVFDPPAGWSADGCLLHAFSGHEGYGASSPVCSPWMTSLFSDAVWRYYVHSGDSKALELVAAFGDYVAEHATYPGGQGLDLVVPWYLASGAMEFTDGGPWSDMEHACDVAGMAVRGAWAKRELGQDPTAIYGVATDLLDTCRYVLDYWHRPAGPDSGLPEWRVNPPRKFSWWFGTTLDLPWLAGDLGADLVQ